MSKAVAVVGSGPAALMAADVVSRAGFAVTLFEKRKSAGRKLLVAGSSGLNITNDLPRDEFIRYCTGTPEFWERNLEAFSPQRWIEFIQGLGIGTFLGTSRRYFVEDLKASVFLKAWTERLKSQKVEFRFAHEWVDFERTSVEAPIKLSFADGSSHEFAAVCLALGGASWEPQETPLRWPSIFTRKNLGFTPFRPSNVGFQVAWSEKFRQEAEGKPLKNILLRTPRGQRRGDAMITSYGLEGTPVYFVGQTGPATLDLLPGLERADIVHRLQNVRENLSAIRRIQKTLALSEAAFALVFHHTPPAILKGSDWPTLAEWLKNFPIQLGEPQPITEAISSSGGLQLAELDDDLMIRRFAGVFAAGEMLDWDVPTGGFLIQGAVSQGVVAGQGMVKYLSAR